MEDKTFEFKASSAEQAVKNGLAELGLTEEDVTVEVLSNGGVFSKAVVRITVKDKPVEENKEEAVEEELAEVKEEAPKKAKADDEKKTVRATEEEVTRVKAFVEGAVALMNVKSRVDVKNHDDELCVFVSGDDAKAVIGYRGEVLDSLQYLANQIANADKTGDEHVRVTVDADFYRERRKRILTSLAKKLAHQAYTERRDIALEPMNSYERRIIHSALQNDIEATTFSEGEGKDRHIVISPKCEKMSYGTSTQFRKKGQGKMRSFGYKKRF